MDTALRHTDICEDAKDVGFGVIPFAHDITSFYRFNKFFLLKKHFY